LDLIALLPQGPFQLGQHDEFVSEIRGGRAYLLELGLQPGDFAILVGDCGVLDLRVRIFTKAFSSSATSSSLFLNFPPFFISSSRLAMTS
jgi:hypothetical protein